MKILSSTFSVFFPLIQNMREHFFEIEKNLGEHFTNFGLLPLPEEAPVEFPRISAISKNGHTNLNFTLQSAQMTVNFDEKFWHDIDACIGYVRERRDLLLKSLSPIVGDRFLFSGLSTLAEFDEIVSPEIFINDSFLKIRTSQPLQDAAIRLTNVVENCYYVNVEIFNRREFSGTRRDSFIVPSVETYNKLVISFDVNDKYAFNYKQNYFTKQETIDKIFSLSEFLCRNKLDELIKSGVLSYDGI